MPWRSATWVRWLGGTLVFGLLFAYVLVLIAYDYLLAGYPAIDDVLLVLFYVAFVLTFVAAFAIGVRFRSSSWVLGPPVAVLATVVTILVLPEPSPVPTVGFTAKDRFWIFLGTVGWILLIILTSVYMLLAWAGVRRGQRREGAVPLPAVAPSGDDARSEQG
jgi:hypothetical protein